MNILGISAYYHDSAAALVQAGAITAAAQEERFTRKKHDPSFPTQAVRFCLNQAGIRPSDLEAIVFYDKPILKFERLLETYYAFAPKGIRSFIQAMPVWVKEKLFSKKLIREKLQEIEPSAKKIPPIFFTEHHLSHAASAFYPSPFEEAALLTVDGVGEWATTTIGHGKGKDITIYKELCFPHSWGLLYTAFTYYLGFKVNSGEYKLMGLAPYGNPEADQTKRFESIIRDELIDLKSDGSLWLNMKYFSYPVGLRMTENQKWEQLFGFPVRLPESELTQAHMNLAYAIQQVTEDGMLRLAEEAQKVSQSKNLVMAGGVALNCVANGKLLRSGLFDRIWIQPAAGDAGGALGAALAYWHLAAEKERRVSPDGKDAMRGSYLGPEFGPLETERLARKYHAPYERHASFDQLCEKVARLMDQGSIIGWFQGRMEWGPRALGNRSIIGDARNPDMQKRLNLKIKYRESFRPFAPSVLIEDVSEYFEMDTESPYMLLVADVVENRRKPFPPGYHELPLKEKLYHIRSDIPAITHLNYSARVETVHKDTNPQYWELIHAFKKLTGYGVIVNTSFNVRGEPIVCTPEDAYRCFMRTEMDYLVIGNDFFDKSQQPAFEDREDWQKEYPLD